MSSADNPQADAAGHDAAASGPDPEAEAEAEAELGRLIAEGAVPELAIEALQRARGDARLAEDRMLRAVAETQNQRARLAKEQADRIRFANEGLLTELLGVLDNLQRCVNHAAQGGQPADLQKGVEATLSQFLDAVQNVGARPIPVEVGGPFDPRLHDAIMQDDRANLPARSIVAVVEGGFTYHERVLRPAKVVVATGKGLQQ
jgi:molecular chaperone GrpE